MKRIPLLIAAGIALAMPQTLLAQSGLAANAAAAVKITEAQYQAESQKILNQLVE